MPTIWHGIRSLITSQPWNMTLETMDWPWDTENICGENIVISRGTRNGKIEIEGFAWCDMCYPLKFVVVVLWRYIHMIQRHLMFFLIFTCFATSFFRSSYHIGNLKTWLVSRGSRKCKKRKGKKKSKGMNRNWECKKVQRDNNEIWGYMPSRLIFGGLD